MANQEDKVADLSKVSAANIKKIEAPTFFASSFRGGWAGNDFNIVLQLPVPAVIAEEDGTVTSVATLEPVCSLHLSAATTKDLLLLLQEQVSIYESRFGTIETEYTKTRALAADAGPKRGPGKKAKAKRLPPN